MSNIKKLKLLLWKNWVLQKRHKWQTVFEILSPVVFSLFLIFVRLLVNPESKPDMTYKPFSPTYINITQEISNITKREGTLAFSPDNEMTKSVVNRALINIAKDNLGFLFLLFDTTQLPEPLAFKDGASMEKHLMKPNVMHHILAGIEFDDKLINATEWPDDIVFKLRFPALMRTPMLEHPIRASWRTNLLFPLFPKPGSRETDDSFGGKMPGYSREAFLALQHALSREIIKDKSGKPFSKEVKMQRFPQMAYREDMLLIALERFISMIIMLCFTYTFVNTVRMVTIEKELQLRETMAIMGLPSWLNWLAWFIKQFIFVSLSAIIMVILLKIPIAASNSGDYYAVLTFTPWSVLLFFFLLFLVVSITFSFMISVFFRRANTAASFMGLAWLTTYSVFMLTQVLYEDISFKTKALLSLISNTAMGYAFQMIVMSEGTGRGLQWSDFFKPISYHDKFMPGHLVLILIFDAFLYMLITMYMEKIRPGLYGVPLPWYFPFTKSFWMPRKNTRVNESNRHSDMQYNDALLKVIHDEEPKDVPMGVNIMNLTKVFKGKKKAVDNLNLRMYENEILVLLGHNGAGKTTTISMMTGLVNPTSGTVFINGFDIVTETERARKSLGICPQHNVLFPDLSVAEHVIFYSRLKGVPDHKLKEEVDHFVKLLNLETKRDVLSSKLSGGQKRRLSVGAAMCGSSRVVLLDEPTSGLDPASRRALWDLLQKEKKGRTIILTTHFMDEADVLGDRIAILSGGRLQCIGSSYFLKKHYGLGYKIACVKGDNCDVTAVTTFFRNYVPDVRVNTNIGSELTYIVSNDHVSKFPNMLKEFESQRQAFGVESYGMSVTSLEEVFMKVGAEDANSIKETRKDTTETEIFNVKSNFKRDVTVVPIEEPNGIDMDGSNHSITKVRGWRLLKNHIKAMFLKLGYNALRNKVTALIQCITPIINIAISVAISRSWKFLTDLPPLALNLEHGFDRTETLVSEDVNNTLRDDYFAYKDYFKSSRVPGMKLNDIGTMDMAKFYLKLGKENLDKVRFETLIGATFSSDQVTAWFSNFGYHDPAISLAVVNNAILKSVSPNSSLTVINHPLPYSIEYLVKVMASGSSMIFQFAFNIGFCMSFVTAFIVLFYVKERISGAKLLQKVSCVQPAVMWTCAFLFDWLWLMVVNFCIVFTLAAFQETTLSTLPELSRVLVVLMIFNFAVIPLHHLASFHFDAPAAGFSKMCFTNMFLGCMPFLITEVLRLPQVGSPYYANIFDWVFSPLPLYCLSRSFRDMGVASFRLTACDEMCRQLNHIKNCTRQMLCDMLKDPVCCIKDDPFFDFYEPGIGRYLFIMIWIGSILFTILLLKEYRIFKKINQCFRKGKTLHLPPLTHQEDDDVRRERNLVHNLTKRDLMREPLVCLDLTKYFNKYLAVDRLSFGVRAGECFGLLGINGAGKTTTFRMLTGDVSLSAGNAFVRGHSVIGDLRAAQALISYCPQFDALFDNLTARETLHIFCLIRGIPSHVGAKHSLRLAEMLGFSRHYDKMVYQCSGGTKRKISSAVALLGDSPLIYLDEPTTGMDPASKRLVWSSLSATVAAGRSVVLTSHSMEECEALCTRLTVMVNGRLYCLGPLQHLKNKFSQGFTLIVKCKFGDNRDADLRNITDYILSKFTKVELIESYLGISSFYLRDENLLWWQIFNVMEAARLQFPIEDYSVSQTTLEQVFLQFTKMQPEVQ